MPKQNKCAIFECGRIKTFRNTTLLASHLKVDPERVRRWRRNLAKENKLMVWSYYGIVIDFQPEQY